jgi:gamma-glutamyl-gamma-aminobutyrate hydrolase PuuD
MGVSRVDLQNCKDIIELMCSMDGNWISSQWHPEYDYKENPASKAILLKFKDMMHR